MDLSTSWLGLRLPHPLMPGASPMVDDLDTVMRLEDAGAAAIVMHSLFEEQIVGEAVGTVRHMDSHAESHPEATTYFPEPPPFALGPDEYLEQIRKIRARIDLPVIASLNGTTRGGWLRYARLMAEAGAAALELNVYDVATELDETSDAIEGRLTEMLRAVKGSVEIPVAVKLSPFYSAFAHVARELERAGADGLVLFNRFYQADIDLEELEAVRRLELSTSSELLLRIRWLAILSGRVKTDLAASGGVHTSTDALKAVMAGAHAVQLVSSLLRSGPEHLRVVREGMERWLEEHEYESLEQARGSMSLLKSPDPRAFERANYVHVLMSWMA